MDPVKKAHMGVPGMLYYTSPFVVLSQMTINGRLLDPGDAFPIDEVPFQRVNILVEQRKLMPGVAAVLELPPEVRTVSDREATPGSSPTGSADPSRVSSSSEPPVSGEPAVARKVVNTPSELSASPDKEESGSDNDDYEQGEA